MILQKIIDQTAQTVLAQKKLVSLAELEQKPHFGRTCVSLKASLLHPERSGIIMEFKRRSPSKGQIAALDVTVEKVVEGYQKAGASGISVLTDTPFFGGKTADVEAARSVLDIPILRKDFIIDAFQIYEAKAMGADVILLIAAGISPEKCAELGSLAKNLGLEVLLEVHNADEIDSHFNDFVDVLGVNNRNLKTFEVSVQTSLDLLEYMPKSVLHISESGLKNVETLATLRQAGFHGFLIGEAFMKTAAPEKAALDFVEKLRTLEGKFKQI